jgi:hypothetical protein
MFALATPSRLKIVIALRDVGRTREYALGDEHVRVLVQEGYRT